VDPLVEKRTSPRISAKIPIVVVGLDVNNESVYEESETILINDAGALVALAAEFQLKDVVQVRNRAARTIAKGQIAFRSEDKIRGRRTYGVALLNPPENFWGQRG